MLSVTPLSDSIPSGSAVGGKITGRCVANGEASRLTFIMTSRGWVPRTCSR